MIKWNKPTTWGVLAFVIGLVIMLFVTEAEAGAVVKLAPESAFVRGDKVTSTTLTFAERFVEDKYELSIGLQTPMKAKDGEYDDGNIALSAKRLVRHKDFEMGIGVSYWKNQTIAWNSNLTFSLSLAWHASDRLLVEYVHDSTGGTSPLNSGLDKVQIGLKFK